MKTAADLLHQAKQGNAQAIATLLNRQLAPRGLRIQAKRKDSVLALLIDSEPLPTPATLMPYLEQSFRKLASPEIERLRVYGRTHNQDKPAWMMEVDLASADVAAQDSTLAELPTPPAPPRSPRKPPPQPQLPTRSFLSQWLLFNSIAGLVAGLMVFGGGGFSGQLPGLSLLVLNVLRATVVSGAQTYVLARRLGNAHWWLVVTCLPLGLLWSVPRPFPIPVGLAMLGLQFWVLQRHCDRAAVGAWWVAGNVLGSISIRFVIAMAGILGFNHGGVGFILLSLFGLWELVWGILSLMTTLVIQGWLLEQVLRPLPEHPVLPIAAYFQTVLRQFWQVGRDRSQPLWQLLQQWRPQAPSQPSKH